MPDTIVYLTKREHQELMHIAKMSETAPSLVCAWAMTGTMMYFDEQGQLPMLPRAYLEVPVNEFRGYRRIRVQHDDWEREYLEKIAEKCRVSKDYIARLSVTQFIATIYRDGLDPAWKELYQKHMSLDTAPMRPDLHAGSHLVPGGPLSTLEERNPPNPRVDG